MSMDNLHKIAEELESLGEAYSKLSWVQYTVGYDLGLEEAYKKIVDFMCDEKKFEIIKELKGKDLDFRDKRKVQMMYDGFEPYHLSKDLVDLSMEIEKKTTELSAILNTHRSKLNGREVSAVELTQILSSDDNSKNRKDAFFARTQINKPLVDGGFIELLNLRKEYAKKRGFENFVQLGLHNDGLNEELFRGWDKQLKDMIPIIQKTKSEAAKKYLNQDSVNPWDEAYLGAKMASALNTKVDMSNFHNILREFFMNFGIDISKYNLTYDIFPRANKSEWGYNFTIATGKDSRVLANVKNMYKEYGVLLHETGHGIHSFKLDPKEIILNKGVSGIISEGIANLFGSFLYEEIFYKNFFKIDEVAEQFRTIKEYGKVNSLTAINSILFDQELYKNDIKSLEDINNLAFKLSKDLLGQEPFGEEYPWGVRIHHTTHPIYLHNYFMGDVTCEMLKKIFCEKYNCKSVIEKPVEFGDFLTKEVIDPSGLYEYPELFKRISGEEFSLKYML